MLAFRDNTGEVNQLVTPNCQSHYKTEVVQTLYFLKNSVYVSSVYVHVCLCIYVFFLV